MFQDQSPAVKIGGREQQQKKDISIQMEEDIFTQTEERRRDNLYYPHLTW